MAAQWHYELFGEEFGPVGEDMLRELIANGTLAEDDRVRSNGGSWQPAGQALAISNSSGTATAVIAEPEDDSADADELPEWYCQVLGQELGPLAFNELLNFARTGELSADDQIRFGATGKWRRVGSMGRLVSVLPYQNSSVTRVGKKKSAAAAPVETQTPPPPTKPAPPQMTYSPAASEAAWFAWIRGVEYGPVSLLQLQQYVTSGQMTATDFVKYGMTGAWCPPSTITQMLAQYVVTVPAPVSRTPTPATAIPTVTAPTATKPSAATVPTVTAPKPATTASKAEITPPVTKPSAEPVAKVEPPRPQPAAEPVSKPAPITTSSAASMNTYSSSTSNWQAKTTTTPYKPPSKPARSSGGGMSFDFSAITAMMDAKTLGIGGGIIAAAALVFAFMYMPAGHGDEVAAFKQLLPIYQKFQKARESNGSAGDVEAEVKKVCPPIAAALEKRASVSRPATQKLFWVAKYRMNEMVAKGTGTRSAAEIECERMLYEVSQVLKLPMDAPKPVEEAATAAKGNGAGKPSGTPAKGPAFLD